MTKRIAVIGSGISGLVSANLLSQKHDVSLFEAENTLGGHTHTIDVAFENEKIAIDTGFVVFNKRTYPQFCKLLEKYNIPFQPSEMSFSFRSDKHAMEYNGHTINTLFADRRNLFKPSFYRFIENILRFNKDANEFLATTQPDINLNDFIRSRNYNSLFINSYLLPVIASIWSKKMSNVLEFPARFLFNFLSQHGLLSVYNRPKWYVISGGSRNYIPFLTKGLEDKIYLNTKIEKIERNLNSVTLKTQDSVFEFDAVVLAVHSDQALKMLASPTDDEVSILGAISYTPNEVILHTDSSVLPRIRRAWASWNYYDIGSDEVTLTYYMNRLQGFTSTRNICLSVNLADKIAPETILYSRTFSHPCFTEAALKAQKKYALINGKNNTYYAGAYWGYGFHEDGVKSAIEVGKLFEVTL